MAVFPRPNKHRATVAAAIAGVVAGHDLAYLLAFSGGAKRAAVLHATGHDYWPAAALTAVGAAAVIMLAAAARGARRRPAPPSAAPAQLVHLQAVVGLQVGLFASMELIERVIAHAPLAKLVQRPELAVGLLAQVAVAVILVAVVRLTERVAAHLAAFLRRRPAWPAVAQRLPRSPVAAGPAGCRRRRRCRAPPRRPAAI